MSVESVCYSSATEECNTAGDAVSLVTCVTVSVTLLQVRAVKLLVWLKSCDSSYRSWGILDFLTSEQILEIQYHTLRLA